MRKPHRLLIGKKYPGLITLAILIAFITSYAAVFAAPHYMCGDSNADGTINVGDVIRDILGVFKCGKEIQCGYTPVPWQSGDANCDGMYNVSDAVYLINHIFRNGPGPCCPPSGLLTDTVGCKQFESGAKDEVPPDRSCLEYEYDGVSTMVVRHINAGINCCPDFGNLIYLPDVYGGVELRIPGYVDGVCDCDCLFDMTYTFYDLPPGEYVIMVMEWREFPGEEPLELSIVLTEEPSSGSYCVSRSYYPWGQWK